MRIFVDEESKKSVGVKRKLDVSEPSTGNSSLVTKKIVIPQELQERC